MIVEHDMDVVFGLATVISVLDAGRLIASGSPDEIRTSAAVQEAYLGPGDRMEELFTVVSALLELRGVRAGYDTGDVLHGVDLDLQQGEVVALLGRNGVGKTTLVNTIVGLVRPRAGVVLLDGRDLAGESPHKIARAGIAIVPQGRRIFSRLTVEENLKLARRAVDGRDGRVEPERRLRTAATAAGAAAPSRQPALRRRAADARDRTRAAREPARPALRRAVRGARSAARRSHDRDDRRPARARAVGDRRRAEPARRRRPRRPGGDHDEGRDRLPRRRRPSSAPTAPPRTPCSACHEPAAHAHGGCTSAAGARSSRPTRTSTAASRLPEGAQRSKQARLVPPEPHELAGDPPHAALPGRPRREPAAAARAARGARPSCRRRARRRRPAGGRGRGGSRRGGAATRGRVAVGHGRRVPPHVLAHGLHLRARRRHSRAGGDDRRPLPQRRGRYRRRLLGDARRRQARDRRADLRRRLRLPPRHGLDGRREADDPVAEHGPLPRRSRLDRPGRVPRPRRVLGRPDRRLPRRGAPGSSRSAAATSSSTTRASRTSTTRASGSTSPRSAGIPNGSTSSTSTTSTRRSPAGRRAWR